MNPTNEPLAPTRVPHWVELRRATDERGVLTPIEPGVDIPFEVRRTFLIHDVSGDRGQHAHRDTQQLLVAVAGSFAVDVSTATESATFALHDRRRALYVPPMTWLRLYDFTSDAVCLVFADTPFADSAYIREWEEFVALSRA